MTTQVSPIRAAASIRPFFTEDYSACVEIVNRTWDFDGHFPPPALASLFKDVYTGGCLGASNFAAVAVEDGTVRGFLFGKAGRAPLRRTDYNGWLGPWRMLARLLAVRGVSLRKKWFYLHIMAQHEANRRKVEPTRENEVNLFAVDPAAQGRGHGKALMNAFLDHCRSLGIRRIALDTDTECNTAFYHRMGFTPKGQFVSPLQKE